MANVQVTWTGPGMRMVGDVDHGPSIFIDSDHPEYGNHTGPSPMELILLGLAGCTAMDVISIMAKKREPMTNLQIKVAAEHAAEHPKIYTKIHLEYIAYGTGIKEKSLERAIRLSEQRYCSVSAMLNKAAAITSSYRIEEAAHPGVPGTIATQAS